MTAQIKKILGPYYRTLRPVYVPVASWYHNTFRAPRRYHHLYDSVKNLKAKRILEIGVWNGKRAVQMIETAQDAGVADVQYYGFDLFEDLGEVGYQEELSKRPPTEAEVTSFIRETKAQVEIFRGNTLASLPAAVPTLPKMDFIFIDGGHSNETVLSDWNNVKELMHENTILIFDDYWRGRTDGGAKLTVDAIDTTKYNVEVLPEIDTFTNPDFGKIHYSFAKVTKRVSGE